MRQRETPEWAIVLVGFVLAMLAMRGCAAHAQEATVAERMQICERLQWQWVPPSSRLANGARIEIPGHWHNRFEPCAVCGDGTVRAGGVSQANPQLAPSPAPATIPASAPPPLQAANPSPNDDRVARLAAELAGEKHQADRNWRAFNERLTRVEKAAASHNAALDAIVPAVERGGRLERVESAVAGLGPRVAGVESVAGTDRESFARRVVAVARPLVVAALIERLPSAAAPLIVSGLSVGGPIGLALAFGASLIGRQMRKRVERDGGRNRGVDREVQPRNQAGVEEAPADRPFRGAGANAASAARDEYGGD